MNYELCILITIIIFMIYSYPYNELFTSLSTRKTRNMSYDLRGEAYYPPILNVPFHNSNLI